MIWFGLLLCLHYRRSTKPQKVVCDPFAESIIFLCRPLVTGGRWSDINHTWLNPCLQFQKNEEKITLKLRAAGEEERREKEEAQSMSLMQDLPLKVPSKLTNPDPIIIAAKESLTNGKGRHYRHGGLVWTAEGEFDIRVSLKNVIRALRFMDTLIKLLRATGHDFDIDHRFTYVVVKQQKIEIQLKELMTPVYVEHQSLYAGGSWTTREYQATGLFALRVGRYSWAKEWKDARLPLEDQLGPILMKIEIAPFIHWVILQSLQIH